MFRIFASLALLVASLTASFALNDSDVPTKIPTYWAFSAPGGNVTCPIPTPSQISTSPGRASWTDGFPPLTFLPAGAGGVPPSGSDFNGVFCQLSQWTRWQNAGAPVFYDGAFATSISGYPKQAVLADLTRVGCFWVSSVDGNANNPDTGGSGWVSTCLDLIVAGNVGIGIGHSGNTITISCNDATSSNKGCVRPDNVTIQVTGGVLGCILATTTVNGCVHPDNSQLTVNGGGTLSIIGSSITNAQLAAGAAAANIGSVGGALSGTLPNPTLANSVNVPGSPTTTTQSIGTSDTTVATTAFANPPGAVVSVPGVVKLPSGLIIQWDVFSIPTQIVVVRNLPGGTFPTGCLALFGSSLTSIPTTGGVTVAAQCVNANQYSVIAAGPSGGSQGVSIMALGH